MRREVSENDSYPLTEVLLEGRNDLPRIDGIVVGALSRFDDSGALASFSRDGVRKVCLPVRQLP